jgi:hypothetical protein
MDTSYIRDGTRENSGFAEGPSGNGTPTCQGEE